MENTSKRELIVSTWRRLGGGSVGKKELRAIHDALAKKFGKGALQGPASIARVLVEAGADLRHPEVIEFDARWRGSQIASEAKKFAGLEQFSSDKPLNLKRADALIGKLEQLRQEFEREKDRQALAQIKTMAAEARGAAQSRTKDRTLPAAIRVEQSEIAVWLSVWLQTPALFADWLELRKRSADFQKMLAGKF